MEIRFSKRFKKQYEKLNKKQKDIFWQRVELWKKNPNNTTLKRHALSGKFKGYYSINITGDHRAIYSVHDNTYIFELVGTHSQLYG